MAICTRVIRFFEGDGADSEALAPTEGLPRQRRKGILPLVPLEGAGGIDRAIAEGVAGELEGIRPLDE